MKAINQNTLFKRLMQGTAALLMMAAAVGCQKDAELDLPLAVNSNLLKLAKTGGKTQIMIYSQSDWKVRFEKPVNWGSLDRLEGTGNYSVRFDYAENLEAHRRVKLIIENGHGIDTVALVQEGVDATLAFAKEVVDVPNVPATVTLPVNTNLYDQSADIRVIRMVDPPTSQSEQGTQSAAPDNAWIGNFAWVKDPETHKLIGLQFPVEPNTTTEPRSAKIGLLFIDGNDKMVETIVDFTQTAKAPKFAFASKVYEVSNAAASISLGLDTDLTYSTKGIVAEAAFPDGIEPWISNVKRDGTKILCDVSANALGVDRKAILRAKYPTAEGQWLTTEVTILQVDSDLRSLIPEAEGQLTITEEISFDGIIISDAGNANLEMNPNLSYTSIDFDENDKTAYIQRHSSSYGLRLKFTAADQNTLARYSSVVLSLKGLTLTKESEPTRYTLSGLTAENIISSLPGTASNVTVKNRKIGELTDEDLYTYVTLKDVQLAMVDGAYTNTHDGFTVKHNTLNPSGSTSPAVDCYKMPIYDKGGNTLNMLINMLTPWRRTGLGVPAGSGDLKGIIVHSKLLRSGPDGNIGRYQIRTLAEEDITLGGSASEGFTKTLVEWNWNDKKLKTEANETSKHKTPILPNVGSGRLYITFADNASSRWGAYGLSTSFNNKVNTGSGTNMTVGQSHQTCININCDEGSWWDFTSAHGEAIIAEFSTASVGTTNMILSFEIAGGSVDDTNLRFPARWQVEYSTDGTTYSKVPDSDFVIRPQAWATHGTRKIPTGLYSTSGMIAYAFPLPTAELRGKANVWIALRPVSTAATWYYEGTNYAKPEAENAESNTLSKDSKGSGPLRLDSFSIRYF